MSSIVFAIILNCLCLRLISGQFVPNFIGNRSTIVHLFEWKWSDIGVECENFLGPYGYGGVQVSPVNENAIIKGRPWWERYQPVSYILTTRSGTEEEFINMIERCNAAGVRIYVDVVFNHMAAGPNNVTGTAGSFAQPANKSFPAVPYTYNDFHTTCSINDYNNAWQVRNCELLGLKDLNQSIPRVQDKIVNFMNRLIDFGVSGFRIDAAKHMWPNDLQIIYKRLKNITYKEDSSIDRRPFIYQEVIDMGNVPISKYEYTNLGVVTEFRYSTEIGKVFRGKTLMHWLSSWGSSWGFMPSNLALVFVDNHDNQRSNTGIDDNYILTYKTPKRYKMAVAFMLAHPYGWPRVMSSFAFNSSDQGPPTTNCATQKLQSNWRVKDKCDVLWICEHRWPAIYNMVIFRNIVANSSLLSWWDNQSNQLAFCRGVKGFIAFNGDSYPLKQSLETCLPPGVYCDVISGQVVNNRCTGRQFAINENGVTNITINAFDDNDLSIEGFIAIHIKAKLI